MKVDIKDREVYVYVDWHELIQKYTEIFEKGIPLKSQSYSDSWEADLRKGKRGNFFSCTASEMMDRIKNGYVFPDTNLNDIPIVTYDRPRPRYTDDPEGEFDNDMFSNGETEYFLSKPKKKSVGGIRFKVQMDFAALVRDKTINEYLMWVGQTLQAIQARGYDVELSVYSHNTFLFRPSGMTNSIHDIRISKFGERIMPKDWSALFSPGGYRHFVFLTWIWAAKEAGLKYPVGLGRCNGPGWAVHWDKDKREFKISCSYMARSFPAEQMTKELDDWKE